MSRSAIHYVTYTTVTFTSMFRYWGHTSCRNIQKHVTHLNVYISARRHVRDADSLRRRSGGGFGRYNHRTLLLFGTMPCVTTLRMLAVTGKHASA